MQTAVPEALRFSEEGEETRRLYGLDHDVTRPFGETCLAARRLSERGVRFVQLYHGTSSNRWDAHAGLKKSYTGLCEKVDQPIAGLLKDLKQRGLLDETLVVLGHRVWTYAGSRRRDRPRPPPLRLLDLDSGRRRKGWLRPRCDGTSWGSMRSRIAIM